MEIGLQHLTKVFPGKGRKNKNKEVVAVDDFNFVIPDGKLVGLLGPSGCGKSTTLNMISGLLKPSAGKIFFGDKDVTDLPPEERGVGMVFQNYALYPHMSVEQNIRFPLENLKGDQKLDPNQMKERVEEAAKLVKIEGLLDRKPGELSGGQQQRVAIARALVKLPRVLLLDEPLSNLDARLRLQTREEIRRIQQKTGITTVFVTHDQDEAMSISDLIVVMKDGVLQQIDSPQNVYDDPANQFVAQFLGTPPITLYDGRIEQGKLWIGNDAVLDVDQKQDQNVVIGVRPEGYILKENGHLHNEFVRTEVMGRDMSVLSKNTACQAPFVRSILSTEHLHLLQDNQAVFDLKPHKVFLFDVNDGQRLRYALSAIAESRDLE
ncbi:ABC transporter ATP-binding protein [Allobaculum stercoricanis]|uniref:ABC transporter ATP-binding protein n=1 Tax=Allobaculum stercoricanis TaxID=174709 RepID=UPI00248EEE3B|nr:ABC transporter ATP-binding protein [Allobaculum stercoricanis]